MMGTDEMNMAISSRKRRLAAFFIDHFVILALLVMVIYIRLGNDFMNESNMEDIQRRVLLIVIPGFLLYFIRDSFKGISLGRWILGIMVRDKNDINAIPSFGRLFIRNLFLIIWPVEFFALVSSNEKRRLGDIVAKTIVIKNPNKSRRLPRILVLSIIVILFFIFVLFVVGAVMKNSDAYKVAVNHIENNQIVIEATGGIEGFGMIPTGNISVVGDKGQAIFEIKVIGKERNITVIVFLIKESEKSWRIIELNSEP